MKKLFLLTVAFVVILLGGCQMTKSTSLVATDLYGDFKLVQFDNEALQSARPKMLSFMPAMGGALKVRAVLCNNVMGEVQLSKGQLSSDNGFVSTRMACLSSKDSLMESTFTSMFEQGVVVSLQANQLILEGKGHQFVYERQ